MVDGKEPFGLTGGWLKRRYSTGGDGEGGGVTRIADSRWGAGGLDANPEAAVRLPAGKPLPVCTPQYTTVRH